MTDYKEKYEQAISRAKEVLSRAKETISAMTDMGGVAKVDDILHIFPELKESEDELTWLTKYIEEEIYYLSMDIRDDEDRIKLKNLQKSLACLEKQGDHNDISNVPSREVILAIWELGNEWKELTNGRISTECGTQLDYIQKHWHESEYYLKEKQGEQKPADKKIRGKDELFDHRYAQYLIEAMHQTYMIQWKGDNLKEVIDFTGKSKNFDEWFKSWDEYETYVHSHGDIFKLFCIDGSHYEVPVGAWIIKTPDGCNIPSRFKFIQKPAEWSEEENNL